MQSTLSVLLQVVLGVASSVAATEDRTLISFDKPEIARSLSIVNDGVMGGRSRSRFKITADKKLEFFGNLSLENNGGFASFRARVANLGLKQGESIVARVRGDGRAYNFNLYTQKNLGGYSYRQSFRTKKSEWIEVQLPTDKFVATWRGRMFPQEKLDPAKVVGLGILLGDKQPGPFKLEVDWIRAGRPRSQSATETKIEVQQREASVE